MSERNGDRARFQRLRRATLLRRERARAAHAALQTEAGADRDTSGGGQSGGLRGRVATADPKHQAD
jgi:hypothetical protein